MAISSWPFDGQDTTEGQYTKLFQMLTTSGVDGDIRGNDLAVTAGNGLAVNVAPGRAYVRGHVLESDQIETLSVPVDGSKELRHSVVLRLDPLADRVSMVVKVGTSNTAPSPTQGETGVYELPLATVRVVANATTITEVIDERWFRASYVGHWDNSRRPRNPWRGQIGYNIDQARHETWTGSEWRPLYVPPKPATRPLLRAYNNVGPFHAANEDKIIHFDELKADTHNMIEGGQGSDIHIRHSGQYAITARGFYLTPRGDYRPDDQGGLFVTFREGTSGINLVTDTTSLAKGYPLNQLTASGVVTLFAGQVINVVARHNYTRNGNSINHEINGVRIELVWVGGDL